MDIQISSIVDNIYNKTGTIFRGRFPDTCLSPFHALFKRESDFITYVTIARNTYKYHQTTFNLRILTFYDIGIAYIINMDVIEKSSDIPYYTRIYKGNYNSYNYLTEVFKPIGINELRFLDGPLCIEAFLMTYKIINNITTKNPCINTMLDIFPFDIADMIYNINFKESDSNSIKNIMTKPFEKPFKVQGIDHGSKRPSYRVVLLDSNGEDENPDINWVDLSEEEYEEDDEE
jgi:hypothetical protein